MLLVMFFLVYLFLAAIYVVIYLLFKFVIIIGDSKNIIFFIGPVVFEVF